MKYAFVIARVLLGLAFTVFGLNAFLHFFSNPPVPGLAGQFMGALLGSHYYVIAFGTELIGGALLLSNRYVPLALTVLGPVIVNILSFHIFLDSENMAPAIVVTVLWFVVFSEVRGSFAGLFVAKTAEVAAVAPKRWPVRSLGKMTFDKLNQVLSNGHRHDVDVHGNPHRAGLAREHAGIGKRQSRDEQRFLRGRQASKTLESKWQRLGRLQFQLPERENGTNMNSSPARPSSVSATLASADHYRRLRIFVFGWVFVMMGAYCVCTNVFAQTSNSRTVERA